MKSRSRLKAIDVAELYDPYDRQISIWFGAPQDRTVSLVDELQKDRAFMGVAGWLCQDLEYDQ